MKTEMWAILLVVFATLIGAFGPIFLKKASARRLSDLKSVMSNSSLFAGLIFYAIGTLLFIPALKGGELSVLYPLVSLTYVWVSFLSVRFLQEKMNNFKWIGIGLIIIGVAFIGFGS